MSVRQVEQSSPSPIALSPRRSRLPAPVAYVVAAAVAIALGWFSHDSSGPGVTVQLDAVVERGSAILVFPDREAWDSASLVPIKPGQRTTYTVSGLPADLGSLRIDPSDENDCRIQLCRLRLLRGGQLWLEFGPAELARMSLSQLAPVSAAPGEPAPCLELMSTGTDPILRIREPALGARGSWLQQLRERWRELIWLLLALPCAAYLLARVAAFGPILWAPLALAGSVPLQGLLWDRELVRGWLAGYLSSDVAVGYANYTGYPKLGEHRVMMLSTLLTALLALGLGLGVRRRWPAVSPSRVASPEPRSAWRWLGLALLLPLVLLNLGVRIPDVPAILHSNTHSPHSANFDHMNYFTWGYAYLEGWQPLRDFWYPYAGFLRHTVPTAASFAGALFHVAVTWVVIGRSVFVLAGRSLLMLSVLLILVAAASVTGILAAESRYNLALGLVLLGVVSRQRAWRLTDGLWFAVYAGYALPYEPHQVLYASVGLAGLWLLDLWRPPSGLARRALWIWLALVAAAIALLAAVWMLDLARQGRLAGQLSFLLHTAGMVSYASLVSSVWDWFDWPTSREALLLYSVLLSLGLGVFLQVWAPRGALSALGALSLACGLLGALTIQKQIVRPHVAMHLLPFVELPLLFWLAALFHHAPRLRDRLALLSLILVSLTAGTGLAPWGLATEVALYRFARLPQGLSLLADRAATSAAQQRYYFAHDLYPDLKPLLARMEPLLGPGLARPAEHSPFLMLGDDSYLYAALHQKPPPYISLYDTSPLPAQLQMVDWLNRTQPRFVVFRPANNAFDLVPHAVRVARLFAAVVADYELLEKVDQFHILRRRLPGTAPALAYFQQSLGDTVDLAALPAYSRLLKLPVCPVVGGAPAATADVGCAAVLQVHIEQPQHGQPLSLQIQAGAQHFVVSLQQRGGVHDYAINLSSLWFWPALRQLVGEPPLSAWSAPAGTQLQLAWRAGAAKILF